jgi:hypothetical protein
MRQKIRPPGTCDDGLPGSEREEQGEHAGQQHGESVHALEPELGGQPGRRDLQSNNFNPFIFFTPCKVQMPPGSGLERPCLSNLSPPDNYGPVIAAFIFMRAICDPEMGETRLDYTSGSDN